MFSEITILLIKFPERSHSAVNVLVLSFRECFAPTLGQMFAAKVARFVIFVEFFYLVEREMGELCVVAGQVQSGGSQPLLSSSAPARSHSTETQPRLRSVF